MAASSNSNAFDAFVTQKIKNLAGSELYRLRDVDQNDKLFCFVLFKRETKFRVVLITEPDRDAGGSVVNVPNAKNTMKKNFDSRDSADDFIQKQRNKQKGLPDIELKNQGLVSPETGMLNVAPRHELESKSVVECTNIVNESVAKGFRGEEIYRRTGKRESGQRFVLVVSKLDYYIVRVILEPVKRQNRNYDANIDWYSCTVHLAQIKEPAAVDNWVAQTGDYLIDGKEPVFLAHWACQRRIVECPFNRKLISALEPGDHIRRKFRDNTFNEAYDSHQEGIYLGDKTVICYTTDNALLKSKKSAGVCTVTLDEFMKGENTLHLVLYRSPHRKGNEVVETAKKLDCFKWYNSFDEVGKNNELFVFLCVHKFVDYKVSNKWVTLALFIEFCMLFAVAIVYLPPRFLSITVYTFLFSLLMLYAYHKDYYTSWSALQKHAWKVYSRLYKNDCTNFDKFVSQKLNNASAHEVYRIRDVDENGKPFLFVFFQRFGFITVVWIREPPKDYNGCYIDDDNIMTSKWFWFRSSADDFIQRRRNQLKGLPRCVELKRNGLLSKETGKAPNESVNPLLEHEIENGLATNPERFNKFEAFVFLSVSLGFRGEEVDRKYGITNAGQYFVFVVSKIDYFVVRVVLESNERFNGTLLEKMYLYSCTIHLPRIQTREKIDNWVKETSAHFVTKRNYILNDWARDGKHVKTCIRDLEACGFGLKPGDHIRRDLKLWKFSPTYHDGIYIGDGKVAHYTVDGTVKLFSSKDDSRAGIVTLEQFMKGESHLYLVLYRSPDRSGDEIVRIAKQCVENNVWHGSYHLAYKNCQLFASYCVRENEKPKPRSVPEVKKWVKSLIWIMAIGLVGCFLLAVSWFVNMLESVIFLYGAGFELHEFPERKIDSILLDDWNALLNLFKTTYFYILVAFLIILMILAWVRDHFQSRAWKECKEAVTS